MGEEVKMTDYGGCGDSNGDDDRVMEWEEGLPSTDDLTPLSQALIPMELMSAFSISPEPRRTIFEVNRASQNTLSSLRGTSHHSFSSNNNFRSFNDEEEKNRNDDDTLVIEDDTTGNDRDGGSESRKMRRVDSPEEADSALRTENSMDGDQSTRTLKRPRLVWTPQLHKRFVDVVAHLGIKNAVPKTIMQMMNVEGLTRENVASHLQKYRLYLKRMQGLSNEGPSASDPLFASTPVPQSLHESTGGNGNGHASMSMPIPMPYPPPMMPMPVLSGHGHMGMHVGNPNAGNYHGFESHHHHPYSMLQQRDWSGNTFGSYPHVAPHEN